MIRSRTFSAESDYDQMLQMVRDTFAATGLPSYCNLGDLEWWRATVSGGEGVTACQLWFDDDRLIAFSWPSSDQTDLVVRPGYEAVEDAMIDWAEAHVRERAGSEGTPGKPIESLLIASESDTERQARFERHGYKLSGYTYYERSRSLEGPIPEPQLPDGFAIRHITDDSELERRVAVHRDAFAPSKMTVEKHQVVRRTETYRPELDLVVVAPDDSFAAYCLVWFDASNKVGLFEPVGCHSDYRQRGLSKAVMYEGLRRLKEFGAELAVVNCKTDSLPANALYESVGFAVADRDGDWVREL